MDWLVLPWKVLVVRGAIGVVLGLVTIIWPMATAFTLVVVLGLWALVDGATTLAGVLRARHSLPGLTVFGLGSVGVLSVVVGLLVLTRPIGTVVALTWILGIWLLVAAAVEITTTLLGSAVGPRWLHVVSAALAAVVGLLLVLNPGAAALALTVWLGVLILLWGGVFVAAGLLARRLSSELAAGAPSTT